MRALVPDDVIFSLKDCYVQGLLSGTKCVELRRRIPTLDGGTRIWLYSKVPTGKLLGMGVLDEIATGRPEELWSQFSQCSGLNEGQFFDYFAGVERGAALIFDAVARLTNPITLEELRELEPNFQPPQFFRRVKSPALRRRLTSSHTGPFHDPCDH